MKQERQHIYRLILLQTIALLAISLFVAGIANSHTAISVWLGGCCCLIPTFYFAHQFFRHLGARHARQTMQIFYVGEVIKLIFTGCLCVFVFKFIPIQPLAFFIGFITTQFMFWCAPIVYNSSQRWEFRVGARGARPRNVCTQYMSSEHPKCNTAEISSAKRSIV